MCRGLVLLLATSISTTFALTVQEEFVKNEVDKAFSIQAPNDLITVKYPEVDVQPGMTLKTGQPTPDPPDVSFEVDSNEYYTFIMLDPDAPSRSNPIVSPYLHWLIVNIPGADDGQSGDVIATYVQPGALPKLGKHRYTFLLFKQPGKVDFNKNADVVKRATRTNWHQAAFAKKYNLGEPIAGNFFLYELLNETDDLTDGAALI